MAVRQETDERLKELVAIKKLLVLALLKSGLTQTQVAGALEMDRSQISRMFPKGTLTGLGGREKADA